MSLSAALQPGHVGDEVVSSEAELLILVDEQDQEVGYQSKAGCHDKGGVLHRAFSLFVFNDRGDVLLQRRAAGKRLWPMYWSNSCCSHPRKGEDMNDAIQRRLFQELRIRCELNYLYKFQYSAAFGEAGSERELCWVYAGTSHDRIRANRNEVADWRFVHPEKLEYELHASPDQFTPWFKLEWPMVREQYFSPLPQGNPGELPVYPSTAGTGSL